MSTYLTNAAINPQLEQELEGQCIFCLQFLRTRNEVRKLPCAHRSCSGCLKEMIARRRDVKCPTCRQVHEGVQLENCPIIYARQIFLCSGSSCKGEAKNYCKKCMKCHCEPHQQYHDEFQDHQDSVIPIEQYRIEVDRYTNRMCTEHNMSEEIKTACSKCHKPLCLSCLGADRCEDETAHEVVALKKVADSMKDVLQTDVKKIIEFDEKLEGSFKEINNQTETLTQRQTDMKKKLNEAVERVIDEVRLFAQELAVKIDDRIANELVKLREYEKDLNPVHRETKQLITKTSQLSSSNDLDIIRHQSNLSQQIEDFCAEQPAAPTVPIFSLSNLREKISFPWEMIVTEPFYKSLTHNENIPIDDSQCYTVCHLPDGKLIHGGNYRLVGLNKKPDLEGAVNCINIDQGSGDLLILCNSGSKNKRFVYKIDPHTSQSELLFSYPNNDSTKLQHLTANSRYIITTDLPTGLKVFDKVAKELLYDIKLAEIKLPFGVEFLDDRSVIVSDLKEGKVFRVLVAENSQILWTLGGLERPSGVHIDHEKKKILVSSNGGEEFYVISFTGELLATITVPDGKVYMHDISVYGSELAIANREHGVRKFTLE